MPHFLLVCILFLLYGTLHAAAVPALLVPKPLPAPATKIYIPTTSIHESRLYGPSRYDKREPKDCLRGCIASTKLLTETALSTTSSATHSTTHLISPSTNLLGNNLCTRATVTVTSTEMSVSTKTHTVTERIVGPTRLGADKPEACIDRTPSTKPQSTSMTSSSTHRRATAPDLAITRRMQARGECTDCLTTGIAPGLPSVKMTSTTPSTPRTEKSSKKATPTSSTTSFDIAHSIHFDKKAAPTFEVALSIDKRATATLAGHAKLEDAPTHG